MKTIMKLVKLVMLLSLFIGSESALADNSSENPKIVGASEATVKAIQAKIVQSRMATKWPAKLAPSLTDLIKKDKYGNPGVYANQGTSLTANCKGSTSEYTYVAPKACFFGDTKSKTTIVLWGDSSAGSWIPAVASAAASLKLRLAVLVAHGCGLYDWTPPGTTLNPGCEKWRAAIPKVIGDLKPTAVIASTLGMGVYSTGDETKIATAWATTFANLTKNTPTAKRIFLGSTPVANKGKSLVSCLSTQTNGQGFKNALQACSPPADGWPLALMQDSNKKSAKAANATLVDTLPWFCDLSDSNNVVCPIVVGNNLVYVDADHLSIAYATTLGSPLKEALVAASIK